LRGYMSITSSNTSRGEKRVKKKIKWLVPEFLRHLLESRSTLGVSRTPTSPQRTKGPLLRSPSRANQGKEAIPGSRSKGGDPVD